MSHSAGEMPLAGSPTDPEPRYFDAPDGTRLAWRELGPGNGAPHEGGRAIVLLHGLFSNGWTNWVRYGHAARLAAAGHRLILPDLRGHGASAAPRDAAGYPPDVLARDGLALIRHLGLVDYDLGGYSLGGRTSLRMVVLGAAPRRLVVAGMGLEGLLHTGGRGGFFRTVIEGRGTHARGTPEWMAEAFLKTTGGDPEAMLPLLGSFVDTPRDALAAIARPTRIICGVDDRDNGSAEALAALLPHGSYREIPGNHMSAVLRPELGAEIADFVG